MHMIGASKVRPPALNGQHPELQDRPSVRTSAPVVVDVRDLRKVFPTRQSTTNRPWWQHFRRGVADQFVAVEGVSFHIQQGEIFGLLGPNGAGKTTTIRMLSTLLEPSSGSATINGYDVTRQAKEVRQTLGAVLTGERSIYWKLTGRENLDYFAALYHLPPAIAKQRVQELVDRLALAHKADELVERYSSGMKQRIAIAKALLANPPVLLLDEPTIGLDPQSARNLRDLILEIKSEGRTILLTTHYMEEADLLSDRVGIIDGGKIIALDTPTNLKRAIRQVDILQLEVEHFDPVLTETLRELSTVQHVVAHAANNDGTWSVAVHTTDSRSLLPKVIDVVTTRSAQIRHLQITEPTLEDVFISLTGKQLRD
jgi:ABC-2 type transport system ATP-binding protein